MEIERYLEYDSAVAPGFSIIELHLEASYF